MTAPIVLNAPLVAEVRGDPLPDRYRAVLTKSGRDGKFLLRVEWLEPKAGEWRGTGGSWYLETLVRGAGEWCQPAGDFVWIDHGQGWGVRGMKAALDEAMNHV